MGSNTSLFFQIATGLIPLLLVGGALSGLTNELKAARPSARRAAQVLVTILAPAVVVAEFFAISEAVSADLSPPLFRTVFVAEILAIETVLLAVGFLLPWFEGWAAAATLAVNVVIAGTVVAGALGTPILIHAVDRAANRRDAAAGHCVRTFQAESDEAYFTALEQLDRLGQRQLALGKRRARLEKRKKSLSPERVREERAAINDELGSIELLRSAAEAYLKSVTAIGNAGRPSDLETVLSGVTGC